MPTTVAGLNSDTIALVGTLAHHTASHIQHHRSCIASSCLASTKSLAISATNIDSIGVYKWITRSRRLKDNWRKVRALIKMHSCAVSYFCALSLAKCKKLSKYSACCLNLGSTLSKLLSINLLVNLYYLGTYCLICAQVYLNLGICIILKQNSFSRAYILHLFDYIPPQHGCVNLCFLNTATRCFVKTATRCFVKTATRYFLKAATRCFLKTAKQVLLKNSSNRRPYKFICMPKFRHPYVPKVPKFRQLR